MKYACFLFWFYHFHHLLETLLETYQKSWFYNDPKFIYLIIYLVWAIPGGVQVLHLFLLSGILHIQLNTEFQETNLCRQHACKQPTCCTLTLVLKS